LFGYNQTLLFENLWLIVEKYFIKGNLITFLASVIANFDGFDLLRLDDEGTYSEMLQ